MENRENALLTEENSATGEETIIVKEANDYTNRKLKCPSCGTEIKDGFVFCQNCGASLNSEEEKTRKKKAPFVISAIILVVLLMVSGVLLVPHIKEKSAEKELATLAESCLIGAWTCDYVVMDGEPNFNIPSGISIVLNDDYTGNLKISDNSNITWEFSKEKTDDKFYGFLWKDDNGSLYMMSINRETSKLCVAISQDTFMVFEKK